MQETNYYDSASTAASKAHQTLTSGSTNYEDFDEAMRIYQEAIAQESKPKRREKTYTPNHKKRNYKGLKNFDRQT